MRLRLRLIFIGTLLVGLAPAVCFSQEADPNEAIESKRLVLETITCKGNENISCDFIRTKLRLHTGAELKDDDVQDARLRLSALSKFKTVDIHLEKGSERGKAIVVVEVVEAHSIALEFAAGVSGFISEIDEPSARWTNINTNIAARVSNQNLFGHQKILEFGVAGGYTEATGKQDWGFSNEVVATTSDDAKESTITADIHYIDPNLFGTERVFLTSSVSYTKAYVDIASSYDVMSPDSGFTFPSNYRSENNEALLTKASLLVGYRLWSFLYVDAVYLYSSDVISSNGENQKYSSKFGSIILGWDSEDDPYFTTEGSRISAVYARQLAGVGCQYGECVWTWSLAYKSTWAITNSSVISVNVGGNPNGMDDRVRPLSPDNSWDDLGITYAHKIFSDGDNPLRNRWYLHVGTGPLGLRRAGQIGGSPDIVTISLGARFEISRFGMISLYASGSRVWPQR